METMMHNIPEVMVKGSRPIVKAEREIGRAHV